MSKERLEEVNHIYEYIKRANDDEDSCNVEQSLNELFSKGFIDWLIEQAERVQELERQNKALELEVDGWFNKANEIHESMLRQDKVIDKFRQQNKRYRETVEEAIKDLENECLWDALIKLKALEESE